jgi:hypothetical protein
VIRFKNLLRELRAYEIPLSANAGHERVEVAQVKRSLVPVVGDEAPAGSLSFKLSRPRTSSRVLPKSITLTAAGTGGDTSEPLPDHVQDVEPFKSAIARRHIRVLPVPVADAPKDQPAEPSAASKPEKTRRGDK